MQTNYSLPSKPTHFITRKTLIMFFLFAFALLIAIGSYIYLLSKTNYLKNISSNAPTPIISKGPQRAAMLRPREFTDENISFFYPDVLVINDTENETVTWNTVLSGTIITEKAMQLARQPLPFGEPTNIYAGKYFDIDDAQEREINGIAIKEYTINCGPGCSYRLDQFKVDLVNYQLSFFIAGPGLSPRAEQILATLRSITPTTTPTSAPGKQACTMEAKLCPDGSSVGRSGPNCEFTPCPQ